MTHINIKLLLLVIFIATSCKSKIKHEHTADESTHDHSANIEESTSYLTLYNAEYELFAEYSIPVVNEPGEFTVHITDLHNYKPVSNGKLIVSLIKANKGIRQTINTPVRPGIYTTRLEPKEAGKYKLKFDLEINGKYEKFELTNIKVFETDEDRHIHGDVKTDKISYSKEQSWKNEFAIQKVISKSFREVINTSGQILSAFEDENFVIAPHSGIVTLKKNILPGKKVYNNEGIGQITGKGLATDNIDVEYTRIKTVFDKAKANFERTQKLIENKIVSQKEFEDASSNYEYAKAAYENIAKQAGNATNNLKAPMSGFVKEIKVKNGQFVEVGTPLVVFAQNKKLIIKADISQAHWHCLPDITEANFSTTYNNKIHSTTDLNGRLISYSRNANESAWSAPIFFAIDNTIGLIPGSYIEVFLLSKPLPNVISVPLEALIEEQGNYFVFIQISGENYEKREVKTGINNGKEIEIISGLAEGEYVVVKGAYQVKLASASSAIPSHGHNH